MSGFAFHPEAVQDLDEIWDHIAEDNPDAADRLIAEVFSTCDRLCSSPHQGQHRPDLASKPLRIAVVRDLLLVYAPEERPLWRLAVLHGRRNPRVLAAILRGRD